MKSIFYLFLGMFFLAMSGLTGCSHPEKNEQLLAEAEHWLENDLPDSARQVLGRLSHPLLFSGRSQARYAEAFTLTGFKTDYPEKSDSLIFTAIDYYRATSDSTACARASWLAALINYRLHRWNRSDSLLNEALAVCPSGEADLLFKIHRWKSILAVNMEKYDRAVEACKKERFYAEQLQRNDLLFFSINDLARAYQAAGQPDSALQAYRKAWEKYRSDDTYWDLATYLHDAIANLYREKKDYRMALEHAWNAKTLRSYRFQAPITNLALARIHMACHRADSARYYLKLAIQSVNPYVAAQGYRYLMELDMADTDYKNAYYNLLNYQQCTDNASSLEESNIEQQVYQEKILKNENEQLKLSRQKQRLYILLLCVFLLLAVLGAYVVYLLNRKKAAQAERKREEERLTEKTRRLENENLLLKQQQELSQLREKTAELRESLFRKLPVVHKIPSLHPAGEDRPAPNPEGRIPLTDDDWNELIEAVDDIYGDFVTRLRQNFPLLTRSELAFCCLLKIKVTMQDLSDIYCISKAGITKKKTRLKNEKLHLQAEEQTLDEFILNF